jgi:cellulose synthase/poly-beta-1,6-N-acetylglucosamine synthase-like glycosyltransferase
MIDHPAFWYLALVSLPVLSLISLDLFLGARSLKHLDQTAPLSLASPPFVSVVVAARNEAAKIEPALQSLLTQDYPNYEVVVVDDRSTDATLPSSTGWHPPTHGCTWFT